MADQILEQARELFEGQIDFEGQKLAEFLATALLATVGAISFIVGYFRQDIKGALLIGLGGTVLTFLAVVPPWPIFNKHPVKWLPVGGQNLDTSELIIDG
ncbi:microsomal signal peptidase 12kDa subunit [Mollisia scopiformis]|uniref:Signal peptidase complex subunit 1 n=1 Tax=Mollisia scopiformis TaxID=149040 RepID=A0A194WUZ2_MOLSC|nr:microsomal signal peptidase 12kDa subunit [Mollisia scopiformis]KUJ11775.1 microsomal signal peptidase 12kDa subunit [Mollisia scopiformis]